MKEAEYIELIKSRWPSRNDNEPTPETIALCDKALAEYPNSYRLWIMRGDLIQLCDYEEAPALTEAERSYRQAIAANTSCSEAYLELGHFLDAVMANPRKAKQFFRKAWLLHRSQDLTNGSKSFASLTRDRLKPAP